MSQLIRKLKPLAIFMLAVTLLLALAVPAWADEHEDGEETLTCDHPVVAYLVQAMAEAEAEGDVTEEDVTAACTALEPYLQAGVGVGQLMKSWYLSQSLPGYGETTEEPTTTDENGIVLETWQDLLDMHLAGQGWGEVMFAYRYAAALADQAEGGEVTPTAEELLSLKTVDGLGWGQIAKAQAIAQATADSDSPVTLEDAAAMLQGGMGWGQIREEYDIEPGPPPWAGRPPWAGGKNKNDVDDLQNGDDTGDTSLQPSAAGPPGQNNRGNGKGPGKNKGGGGNRGNSGNAPGHNK